MLRSRDIISASSVLHACARVRSSVGRRQIISKVFRSVVMRTFAGTWSSLILHLVRTFLMEDGGVKGKGTISGSFPLCAWIL